MIWNSFELVCCLANSESLTVSNVFQIFAVLSFKRLTYDNRYPWQGEIGSRSQIL